MQSSFAVFGMIKRHMAIRLLLNAVSFFKLGKLFPKACGQGLIFTLHHVRPAAPSTFDPNALLNITPEFLEQAIIASKEAGLIAVRLEDLPTLLAGADTSKKYVCFTLDDGYKDNAEFAAPIFRKHNVPYTIFICPGLTRRTRTMWWETVADILRDHSKISFDFGSGLEDLKVTSWYGKQAAFFRFAKFVEVTDEDNAVQRIDILAKSLGIDPMAIVERDVMNEAELRALAKDPLVSFGGHTMTHCNLARVTPERLQYELSESCKVTAGYAGKSIPTFAYPYGHSHTVGKREFAAAKKLGLKLAVTTQPGVLKACSLDNVTALNRVSLNGWYQRPRFVKALISGVPFLFVK